jgi:hypothetical protein
MGLMLKRENMATRPSIPRQLHYRALADYGLAGEAIQHESVFTRG